MTIVVHPKQIPRLLDHLPSLSGLSAFLDPAPSLSLFLINETPHFLFVGTNPTLLRSLLTVSNGLVSCWLDPES